MMYSGDDKCYQLDYLYQTYPVANKILAASQQIVYNSPAFYKAWRIELSFTLGTLCISVVGSQEMGKNKQAEDNPVNPDRLENIFQENVGKKNQINTKIKQRHYLEVGN